MLKSIVMFFLLVMEVYLAIGLIFAVYFVVKGVHRIDPVAEKGSYGFRLLILPGTVALWPLLFLRMISSSPHPPEEKNAHRTSKTGA